MKKQDKNKPAERPVWVLCPRCELNYMQKPEKYCDVCKAELGMGDPSILLPDEEEAQVERLCPVCRVNLLGEDEDVCFECKKDMEAKEKESSELSEDDVTDDWEPFDDEEEEEIPDGMQEILLEDEEEEEEEEEEIESVSDEPDDFDFNVDPNDFVEDDDEDDEN